MEETSLSTYKYKESEWYVKYQYNSTTKGYDPVFYSAQQVKNADYSEKTGASLSSVKSYTYGQSTESVEIRNQKARVEQDSSGRYKSIYIYQTDEEGNIQTDEDGNPVVVKGDPGNSNMQEIGDRYTERQRLRHEASGICRAAWQTV